MFIIFHVLISHLYVLFGEISVKCSAHFLIGLFFLILSCMSFLYILEINPLSVVSFAIISSHSEGYLFILFLVSFDVQKFLSWIRFYLFLFPLLYEVGHGGSCCDLCQRVFCLCYPLRVLESCFTFRSLVHIDSIFVFGVRKCSNFFLLYIVFQFS